MKKQGELLIHILTIYSEGRTPRQIAHSKNLRLEFVLEIIEAYYRPQIRSKCMEEERVLPSNEIITKLYTEKHYRRDRSIYEIAYLCNCTVPEIKSLIKNLNLKRPKEKPQDNMIRRSKRSLKGYPYINHSGYRVILIEDKPVVEHRYVWEKLNGPIPNDHVIHHINFIKLDNRIENLHLIHKKQHSLLHKKILERGVSMALEKGVHEDLVKEYMDLTTQGAL